MHAFRKNVPGARDRFGRRAALFFGVFGVVLTACIASSTRAFDEPETAGVGLRGILPDEIPEDLTIEAFDGLGENWRQWSEDVVADLARLYEDEDLDLAGQRAALRSLDRKIRTMDRAIVDPAYASIYDQLVNLRGRLARRIDLAAAVLDTLQLDPQATQNGRVTTAAQGVAVALDDLDAYLTRIPNGAPWLRYLRADNLRNAVLTRPAAPATQSLAAGVRDKLRGRNDLSDPAQAEFLNRAPFADLEGSLNGYLQTAQADATNDPQNLRGRLAELVQAVEAYELRGSQEAARTARSAYSSIRRQAPDGGERITAALQTQYFNHNLRVFVDEPIVNQFFAQTRTVSTPVSDFVLGASVGGAQTTVTEVGVNLKPARNVARFDITLNGAINSQTTGVTKQAAVYTAGNHFFYATKEVLFDGDQFATLPALIGVNPNNMTVGADTKASGIPLLGGIASKIAVREAERRRPQSEAIASQRISSRVVPEFDAETDAAFVRANVDLQEQTFAPLRQLRLFPQARHFSTTHDQLRIGTRLMERDELAGSAPPIMLNVPNALNMHVHQSLLNNGLDRIDLAGRTMTEEELLQEFEAFFSVLLNRPVVLERPPRPEDPEDERIPSAFIFAETDPMRVRLADGILALTMRTGFRQQDRDDIPLQEITIPLNFTLDGDDLLVERVGEIRVSAVERPPSIAEQIAHAGVIRRMIGRATPPRRFSRLLDLQREDRPDVQLVLIQIKAVDGWMTISAQ